MFTVSRSEHRWLSLRLSLRLGASREGCVCGLEHTVNTAVQETIIYVRSKL